MSFVTYTPTPVHFTTLSEADGVEPLQAATTNVSLEQIADGMVHLDQDKLSAPGGVVTDPVTFGDTVTFADTLEMSGSDAVYVDRSTELSASGAAPTLTTAADFYWVDTPSVDIVCTLKSTSPAPLANAEIEFAVYDLNTGRTLDIQREGGESVVMFSGAPGGIYGHAKFRFLSGSWRLAGVSSEGTITYGVPG